MKWLKKWSYLFLMIGTGVVYLSVVDKWQIYEEPIAYAREIYGELTGADMGQTEPEDSRNQENGEQDRKEGEPGEPDNQGEPNQTEPDNQGEPNQTEPDNQGETHAPEDVTEDVDPEPGTEDSTDPVYMSVEDDYFADAVFIGDSRTVGMFEYGGLEEISTFYASTGLTVYKLFDADIVSVPGKRKKISVEEALLENSFQKIYLMIGINEMGTGTVETFAAKYREVIDHLQELQPDAIIYIQGIMKVTEKRSNQGDYITNEGIEARNVELAKIADNIRTFYLDVNPEICDETGGMVEDYTYDGVHLKAQYIETWKDFLKEHAIRQKVLD